MHHNEPWVPDLTPAQAPWGWLPARLGAEPSQVWESAGSADDVDALAPEAPDHGWMVPAGG